MTTLYVAPQWWVSPAEIEAAQVNHLYIKRRACLIDGVVHELYLQVDFVGETRLTEETWTTFGGIVTIMYTHEKVQYTYQAVCPKTEPKPPFKVLKNACVITLGDQI